MTPLRQKMIEDMQLRGLAERTQERYVAAVRGLAEYTGKSPAKVFYEDDEVIVFNDYRPRAPIHLLICPKDH